MPPNDPTPASSAYEGPGNPKAAVKKTKKKKAKKHHKTQTNKKSHKRASAEREGGTMKKRLGYLLLTSTAVVLIAAAPASASFGFKEVDVTFNNEDGSPVTQAGSHPFSMTTTLGVNTRPISESPFEIPDEDSKDIRIPQVEGLVGSPGVVPRCTTAEFLDKSCPVGSQVGVNDVTYGSPDEIAHVPVYSLTPPPGVAMKLGFHVNFVPVTIELGVNEAPPYDVVASLENIPNAVPFYRSALTLWGVPASPAHDKERDLHPKLSTQLQWFGHHRRRALPDRAARLQGPLEHELRRRLLAAPGVFDLRELPYPRRRRSTQPQGMTGCGKLGFNPSITAQPTTKAAESPTGLDFCLDVARRRA